MFNCYFYWCGERCFFEILCCFFRFFVIRIILLLNRGIYVLYVGIRIFILYNYESFLLVDVIFGYWGVFYFKGMS